MLNRFRRCSFACLSSLLLVACASEPIEPGETTPKATEEEAEETEGGKPDATGESAPALPAKPELRRLVASSLLELKASLEAGDFVAFRAACGAPIKSNYTTAQLQKQMSKFVGKEAQIAKIRGVEPVFGRSPGIDQDGVLRLIGRYPTRPERVVFELNYTHEDGSWKLAGLALRFQGLEAPSEKQVRRLLTASLQGLSQALSAGDFAAFHATLSSRFQRESSAQQLKESFAPLAAEQAALESAVRLPATWRVAPRLDSMGELVVSATYATQPRRLRVDSRFEHEGSGWKALGLVVKLEPIPTEEELRRLVHTNLLALNQALKADDVAGFHDSMATLFKSELDVAKLQELIGGFDGRDLLAELEAKQPILDQLPELESDRVLRLTGHYATQPKRLSFTLRFLQESKQWKLAGLNLSARRVPSAEETQALLQASVLVLATALETGDFGALRDGAAATLQKKYTVEQLAAVFEPLSGHHEALRAAAGMAPAHAAMPRVDGKGDLHAAGEFQSTPAVPFKISFRYEGEAWRLLDMSVSIRRDPGSLPAQAELVQLVKSTLLEFDRAVKAGDLGRFYRSNCARRFQAKVTLDRLHRAFAGFIKAGRDISDLEGVAPAFEPAPAVGPSGVLSLTGSFPTKPKQVAFKLRFSQEDTVWRVVGIEVFLR